MTSTKALPPPIQVTSADRKSTRLNSSHLQISYAVFCLKKKNHLRRRHGSLRARVGISFRSILDVTLHASVQRQSTVLPNDRAAALVTSRRSASCRRPLA